ALAWLNLLIRLIGRGKPLGELTHAELRAFGASHARKLYPGVPGLIRDLKREVDKHKNIRIEFFIISGGLQEVIEAVPLVAEHFRAVYASQLGSDARGVPTEIKRCVTFTEKTRYLFEINKGLDPSKTKKNPYLVNEDVPEPNRKIPFKNTVYVGDGYTDIPCFSLIKKAGKQPGAPIGV